MGIGLSQFKYEAYRNSKKEAGKVFIYLVFKLIKSLSAFKAM